MNEKVQYYSAGAQYVFPIVLSFKGSFSFSFIKLLVGDLHCKNNQQRLSDIFDVKVGPNQFPEWFAIQLF